jgi:hypothetical protein
MSEFRKIIFLIFLFSMYSINAQELKFGWNVGNIKIYYDVLDNKAKGDVDIFHFNWLYNKFSIGFNLLGIYDVYSDEKARYSIIPLEIAYVPFNYNNWLFLSIYGKAAWQLTKNENDNKIKHGFYGSIGVNFFIFPKWLSSYSVYFSLYTEYNTLKKINIGLCIDLGVLFYLWSGTTKE